MKTEKEIRDHAQKLIKDNKHVLDCGPATVEVNAARALIQLAVQAELEGLYWALGEERPKFLCDDPTKKDM